MAAVAAAAAAAATATPSSSPFGRIDRVLRRPPAETNKTVTNAASRPISSSAALSWHHHHAGCVPHRCALIFLRKKRQKTFYCKVLKHRSVRVGRFLSLFATPSNFSPTTAIHAISTLLMYALWATSGDYRYTKLLRTRFITGSLNFKSLFLRLIYFLCDFFYCISIFFN